MRLLRGCAGLLLGLGLISSGPAQESPLAPAEKLKKVMIYPAPEDSVSQLKERGITAVRDCGAYWIAEVTTAQRQSLRQSLGSRVQSGDHLNWIELANAKFDTTVGEPNIPEPLRQSVTTGRRLRLVQFKGPVLPEWLTQLKATGARVIHYVPNNAYLVQLDAAGEARLKTLTGPTGPVQWLGAYHPQYKIKKGLAPIDFSAGNDQINVRVAVVDGPEAAATIATLRQNAHGNSSEPFVQLNRQIIQLTVGAADVPAIAQMPDVLWIERIAARVMHDEKQDLILAGDVSQQPGNAPVSAIYGGQRYLDFLFNNVGGGLAEFTNSATYPIVDIADTGLDIGSTSPAHPDFYELGDPTGPSRVVYVNIAGYPGDTACVWVNNFMPGADFCGHGTFVASIVSGYNNTPSNQMVTCNQTLEECAGSGSGSNFVCAITNTTFTFPQTQTVVDPDGFQFGMGVSPFGLIGVTRIFSQDVKLLSCSPYVYQVLPCLFCATSLPVLAGQEYISQARIANNSWGDDLMSTPNGQFVNAGAYTADCVTYDMATRDALQTGAPYTPPPFPLNQELIAVFAGGDWGSQGNVGGFGDLVMTAPATAKNIIAVGASENVRLSGDGCMSTLDQDDSFAISGETSFGPTQDGRFKPEIVAPGSSIYGATDLISFEEAFLTCTSDGHNNCGATCFIEEGSQDPSCAGLYTCGAGTSYAAPAVSGGLQLLWWYFQHRLVNELGNHMLQPSPAMAKAYLCNSARYLPITDPSTGAMDTLPSIDQGMGIMDLATMFDSVPRVLRDESSPNRAIDTPLISTNPAPQQTYFSQSGQSYEVTGRVADPTLPFRVTLAWTDPPGDPANSKQLVNGLTLQVSVNGKTYYGNVFTEQYSTPGGFFDTVNNLQSVFLPGGQTGTWSVVISAANIAGTGVPNLGTSLNQDFALVVYNGTQPSDVPNLHTNNSPATAFPITQFPFTWTNNLTATVYHKPMPSSSAGLGGPEEFFVIHFPTPGTTVSANTFGSNFRTVLSVWKGQIGALEEVTSNVSASNTAQSAVSWSVTDTNNYYIIAEGRAGATGKLVVNASATLPPISFQPPVADFGSVYLTANTNVTVTLQNGSSVNATLYSATLSGPNAGDFSIVVDECSGGILPPGATCEFILNFAPTALGPRSATLTVVDSVLGSPHLLPLTGIGLAETPMVCPSSTAGLTFGKEPINVSSAPQMLTITNCGTADLFITNVIPVGVAAADYAVSTDLCSGHLIAPGDTCTFSVIFTPTATGTRVATLQINDNSATSPEGIGLSGTGQLPTPQSCLPAALNFGNLAVGLTGSVQSLTVSNCGTAPLTVSSVSLTGGTNATEFLIRSNACVGGSIPINGTCTLGLQFAPVVIGAANTTLQIFDNVAGSPQLVTLTGTGNGSQPELAISQTASLKNLETNLTVTIKHGAKLVFYVPVENGGNSPDSFLILGTLAVQGTNSVGTVHYFLGAIPDKNCGICDITSAVEAGTYSTDSLAPGASTSAATLLRVEIDTSKTAAKGPYLLTVTGTSASNLLRTDTVTVTLVVR